MAPIAGWLMCMLVLAAADPLWTLWRIGDDGNVMRFREGMEREACERSRESLDVFANMYVEIDRDVVELRQRPVGKRVHFACRRDGEGPE